MQSQIIQTSSKNIHTWTTIVPYILFSIGTILKPLYVCYSSVNPDQCQHEGATVQFTVMDHDVVFQNDFAGEVFLAMADVPGVDGREIARFDALPTINLPLLQLKQKCKHFTQFISVVYVEVLIFRL